MKNKFPYLHVYAQPCNHEHSFLVGNREALISLRTAINKALECNEGGFTAFSADGEGFNLKVYLEEAQTYWDNAQLPYIDPPAVDNREGAIGPWQLLTRRRDDNKANSTKEEKAD